MWMSPRESLHQTHVRHVNVLQHLDTSLQMPKRHMSAEHCAGSVGVKPDGHDGTAWQQNGGSWTGTSLRHGIVLQHLVASTHFPDAISSAVQLQSCLVAAGHDGMAWQQIGVGTTGAGAFLRHVNVLQHRLASTHVPDATSSAVQVRSTVVSAGARRHGQAADAGAPPCGTGSSCSTS